MPSGKPNFTGLWQVLGTADWDIRDHSAQAGPFFQLGAIGATPANRLAVAQRETFHHVGSIGLEISGAVEPAWMARSQNG